MRSLASRLRVVLLVASLALACLHQPAALASPLQTSPAERQPYLGTWQRQFADSTGRTKITLEITADATYTKALDAFLKGQSLHGSEQGSWAANGPLVLLSGDSQFPASRHDLRNYKRIA